MKTKLSCWPVVLLMLVLLLELAEEEDRSSIQGTATCFPELLVNELELLPELPDEVPLGLVPLPLLGLVLLPLPGLVLLPLPGLVLLLPELLPLPELSDSTANSIRPEFGLMIVSLMVPKVSPEEPATLAPFNWLARTCCCPERPVALHRFELDWVPEPYLLLLDGSVDPVLLDEPLDDELCACAPMPMHTALTAIILSSCFFI